MREEKTKYYVIKEKAVPEVLLKVIEAKRLMDMQELTVQQATEKAESAEALSINTKMIFFLFMTMQKEKRLRLFCRWTMSRDCFPMC